ncbi:hypothetical protein [Limnoraphis robusta]|uniref:CRISPR type III-B/RAMP module-associated protein Cmr5 n=1 Tax=Limnoraphis robusta CS-951 TaxID=1637645 RepID=A0A0F5YFZ0_9CYAN|nr:hypothetical protein [Limnoraphis robusta]KKD37829.1 hypothetical protein WN50_12010 [Limnoraphis robusta CS-951]
MDQNVVSYELDREVFQLLKAGAGSIEQIKQWQGAASGIADYVSNWGVVRFWAMSRSLRLLNGEIPDANEGSDEQRRYFAWGVARVVLCKIVGNDLNIRSNMTTDEFQERFQNLNFNEQVLLTDLLIEIADTIQFWTMRLKDAKNSKTEP